MALNMNYCNVCKITNNLKKCSICNYICYCSINCQKIDWLEHKIMCKKIIKFGEENKVSNYGIDNIEVIIKDFKKWLKKENNYIYKLSQKNIKKISCKNKFLICNLNYENEFKYINHNISEKNLNDVNVLEYIKITDYDKYRIIFFNIHINSANKILKQVAYIGKDD